MEDQNTQELDHNEQQNAQDIAAQQAAIAQQEAITTQNPNTGQENG
jgi:hypothetical protein